MRCLVALLCLGLFASPTFAQLRVPVTEFDLPNGLHVILHEDHRTPLVATNIRYFVGSANETPGRTGFAHLFEHLLFEGSAHVAQGEFDTLLEAQGGSNNASTGPDATEYHILAPTRALDLGLFLESDRMGYLLDTMSPNVVDYQRDVVKNERRQSYENRPYGMAELKLGELLWPENHPYHWPTIGYMPDLDAAGFEDVVAFYRTYYVPGNASLVVAGDIDPIVVRAQVENWFSDIPKQPTPARVTADPVSLKSVKQAKLYDNVALARLYLSWVTPPKFKADNAALDLAADLLTGSKNSRLYKRLVYDLQVAQSVDAIQDSGALGSSFTIVITAKPGQNLGDLQHIVDEELGKLALEEPSRHEVERSVSGLESRLYNLLENLEEMADQMNDYYQFLGKADGFSSDLKRYQDLTPADVRSAVKRYLVGMSRVEISVYPKEGQS